MPCWFIFVCERFDSVYELFGGYGVECDGGDVECDLWHMSSGFVFVGRRVDGVYFVCAGDVFGGVRCVECEYLSAVCAGDVRDGERVDSVYELFGGYGVECDGGDEGEYVCEVCGGFVFGDEWVVGVYIV